MRIRPTLHSNGKGYLTAFRHPFKNKKVVKGWLSTREEKTAWAICRELEALCADAANWTSAQDPRLSSTYSERALQIFFGSDEAVRPRVHGKGERVVRDLLAELVKRGMQPGTSTEPRAIIREIVDAFDVLKAAHLKDAGELASLRDRFEVLESENHQLKRRHNVHVKILFPDAVKAWKAEYPQGRAGITVQQALEAVESFLAWVLVHVAPRAKLTDINGGHIDRWIAQLKNQKDEEGSRRDIARNLPPRKIRALNPPTARKKRAYLSGFFTWAVRRFDLSENPMDKSGPVAGLARHPEDIIAIRREEELLGLIEALKKNLYWQAWVAVACLAGPRWSEQASLRLEDVYLKENYLRIANQGSGRKTKTGRERRVPIERTVLLGILKKHLAQRKREQKSGKLPGHKSPWLFPSLLGENPFMPRVKSRPGAWSDNSAFIKSWHAVAQKRGKRQGAWDFGPSEWRHTFGTALGMCGWGSLEISRVMGNSEEICRRHYVAATSAGKRWKFKWS